MVPQAVRVHRCLADSLVAAQVVVAVRQVLWVMAVRVAPEERGAVAEVGAVVL